MQIGTTLQLVCLVVMVSVGLAACQREPPSPKSPVPASGPVSVPVPPVPAVAATEPATEPTTEPVVAPSAHVEAWDLPGSLQPLTTRLELEARFGKDNVREETFNGPEGDGTYAALVVFPEDPRKRLELVQDAENPDAPLVELRISNPTTRWHHANGLRPGMTLAELVALNGAPVSFYGLAWDFGGAVQDWHGGTLANAVDAPTFHRVTLVTRAEASDARVPLGDRSFRSDDARYPTVGKDLVIGELGISWPHEGED